MAINFDFAKKFAAEQVIEQAMHYLEKDPEKNFIKVLNLKRITRKAYQNFNGLGKDSLFQVSYSQSD